MKILVIHPGSLGDVILSLPALHALRQAYPRARLELIGRGSILELLNGRFYADRTISIDRGDVSSCLMGQAALSDPLACTLRDSHFVINWLDGETGEVSQNLRRIGVKRVIASRPISQKTDQKHRTEIFLEALSSLGISMPLTRPQLFPSMEDRRLGEEALIRKGIKVSSGPILAIHPGSGGPSKCWKLSRFVEVSRQARESLGFQPIFILGPAEERLAPRLKASLGDKTVILSASGGCLPLPVLAGALSWCSGFLGNDSGVTHLAVALGVPTVAIFGPTDPLLWGPLGPSVTILSKRELCAQCLQTGSPGLRNELRSEHCCLDLVSVEEVVQALTKIACLSSIY
ncbi:MAG: glycosyltransferase family 9 protein [Nitrospiria bacterium]